MDNNAFDEALRRVAADEKLPYAPEEWTRMAARLDAHSAGKKRGLVLPLRAIRWAAAAAVVALALAAGWWLRDATTRTSSNTPKLARSEETKTPTTQSRPTLSAPEAIESASSPATTPEQFAGRKSTGIASSRNTAVRQSKQAAGIAVVQTQQPASAKNVTTPTPSTSSPSNVAVAPQSEVISTAPRKPSPPNIAFFPDNADAVKPARGTGFDLAGGYGFGGETPAFSLGVAVKQRLTRRLQLEGALALVGNTPDPFLAGAKSDDVMAASFDAGSPGVGTSASIVAAQEAAAAEAEYEDLRARQLFVQAAPVLMYRVVGGLSAGGGVDAQRRVSSNSSLRETRLNSFTTSSLPALPEWDFGLAMRADYNVTKRLRFGLQYRESLRATSAAGAKAAGRDYWLLQAGYRIR